MNTITRTRTSPDAPTREDVLAECQAAADRWAHAPGRNLVLLFDGTGNILGNQKDTNVVKLLRLLSKHSPAEPSRPAQVVYYDPGVGTNNEFPADGFVSKVDGFFRKLKGLALGGGAFDNIAQAYEFLCSTHEEGDRIFLFGFSRGAFTARAVGGMVNMYGLVHAPGLPLIRSLVRTYFARPGAERTAFARDVIGNFSLGRTPLVHFVGVWDTVETIGSGLLGGLSITNSKDFERKRFVHVRHAMALHETRIKYTPRRYTAPAFTPQEKACRSFDERWFRGVHSDIGGSYARDGLSNVTLAWMLAQAQPCGLLVARDNPHAPDSQAALHDQTLDSPYWAWTGINARAVPPDATLDESARPLANATPATRSPGAWPWTVLGWGLFLVLAGLFAWGFLGGGKISCNAAAIRAGLCHDWAILTVLALWLAYPMAWALRRMSARAIVTGTRLNWLARNTHRWMLALVLSDVAENLMAAYATGWVTTIAWLCYAKLALAVVLGLVWLMGLFSRRPPPVQPAGLADGQHEEIVATQTGNRKLPLQ